MVSHQKAKNSQGPMINEHLPGVGSCVQCFWESNMRDTYSSFSRTLPRSRVEETDTDLNKIHTYLWKMGRVLMGEMEGHCPGRRKGRSKGKAWDMSGEQGGGWCGWNAGEERAGQLGRTLREHWGLPKASKGQFHQKTDTVRGTESEGRNLHP